MMKKKLTALVLALAMTVGLTQGAFAAEPAVPEFDENDYTEVVVFSDGGQKSGIQLMSEADPADNINQAKAGVRALKLGKMGFGYIEEACLAELDEIAKDENVILNEYIVLVPQNRAITPTYYTTYKGLEIYMQATGKAAVSPIWRDFGDYNTYTNWAQDSVSLAMCFSNSPALSVTWTVLLSLAGLPSTYKPYKNDTMDVKANILPQNRAFYVKEGDTFKLVYNREYGYVRPAIVYHNNIVFGPSTEVKDLPAQFYSDISSSNRDDILQLCYDVYTYNGSAPTVTLQSKVNWRWIAAQA